MLKYAITHMEVPEITGNWSVEFKDLVKCCLKRDPKERPTIMQLLYDHDFLAGIDVNECQKAWMRDVANFKNSQHSDSY